MGYVGSERRIHRVFVTKNTEYHVRRQTCVAVRDRESGDWVAAHFALNRPVIGSIRFFQTGGLSSAPALPRVGESMYFEDSGRDLVTSAVISVERPNRDIVARYPG